MKKPNIIVHLDVSPEESLRRIKMVRAPDVPPRAAPLYGDPKPRAEERAGCGGWVAAGARL